MTDFHIKKHRQRDVQPHQSRAGQQADGKRDVYLYQHGQNIAQWGLLQLYEVADENMNPAQLKQLAQNLLELKNRSSRRCPLRLSGICGSVPETPFM